MKYRDKFFVASMIAICLATASNISYAETIVHHERHAHRPVQATDQNRMNQPVSVTESVNSTQTKKTTPSGVSDYMEKETTHEEKNEQTSLIDQSVVAVESSRKEQGETEVTDETSEKKDNQVSTKDKIQSLEMMMPFSLLPLASDSNPTFGLTVHDHFVNYISMYYTLDSEQNRDLIISVTRQRFTSLLSSEDCTYFEVQSSNKNQSFAPVFSKKHPIHLIYKKNGVEKKAQIKKFRFTNDVATAYEKNFGPLKDIIYSSEVMLEVYREDQQYHRIKIPEEVIQQWKEVFTADLKKIKEKQLNR